MCILWLIIVLTIQYKGFIVMMKPESQDISSELRETAELRQPAKVISGTECDSGPCTSSDLHEKGGHYPQAIESAEIVEKVTLEEIVPVRHHGNPRRSEKPENRHCQHIVKNFAYIVKHMNFVDRVATYLLRHHVLDEQTLCGILKSLHANGPTCATEDMLLVLYRDPDPTHHEIFHQSLEETGQSALARELKDHVIGQTDHDSHTQEGRSLLADPAMLTDDIILRQVQENKALPEIVLDFASQSIARFLLNVDLKSFVADLQQRMIISHREHVQLKQDVKTPTDCIDSLIVFLQNKSQRTLKDFISFIEGNPQTQGLASFISIVLERCKETMEKQESLNNIQTLSEHRDVKVEIMTDAKQGRIPWKEITLKIMETQDVVCLKVVGANGKLVHGEEKCLRLTVVLDNYWELENLQKNIQSGLFNRRLHTWLENTGFSVLPETKFETVLKLVKEHDGEQEIKIPYAHHNEGVAVKTENMNSTRLTSTCEGKVQSLVKEELQNINVKTEPWQEALQSNFFTFCDHLQNVDLLEQLLAENDLIEVKDETVLRSEGINSDIKAFILLKHVICQTTKAYVILVNFLLQTEQCKLIVLLPFTDFQKITASMAFEMKYTDLESDVCLHAKMDDKGEKLQPFEPNPARVDSLHFLSYTKEKNIKLPSPVHKLQQSNQELWCISSDKLNVYSLDNGKHLRTIILQGVVYARNVVRTNTSLLLVADLFTGLQLLTDKGTHLQTVSPCKFSDVCVSDDQKIYALECRREKPHVCILKHTDKGVFDHGQVFLPGYEEGDQFDTLVVRSPQIIIASYSQHSVFVYSLDDMELLTKYNREQGFSGLSYPLHQPILCNVDSMGNILVVDHMNHTLQILSTTGFWEVVHLDSENSTGALWDAVLVEKANCLWVLEGFTDLSKYTGVGKSGEF